MPTMCTQILSLRKFHSKYLMRCTNLREVCPNYSVFEVSSSGWRPTWKKPFDFCPTCLCCDLPGGVAFVSDLSFCGPKSEFLSADFFSDFPTCQSCQCNSLGSVSLKCSSNGKCDCKVGYNGQKCSDCAEGFAKNTTGSCIGKIFCS